MATIPIGGNTKTLGIDMKTMAIFSAVFLSGCATSYFRTDLSSATPEGLYPATRADVSGAIRYCRNDLDPFVGLSGAATPKKPNLAGKALWVTFAVIDLPISLVTDTVFLPSDISRRKESKLEKQKTNSKSDNGECLAPPP